MKKETLVDEDGKERGRARRLREARRIQEKKRVRRENGRVLSRERDLR